MIESTQSAWPRAGCAATCGVRRWNVAKSVFFCPAAKLRWCWHRSPALFMLERLRDEAHRFAITHHRKLRRQSTLYSALEDIPGVGAQRRARPCCVISAA
ncbi:MAG: hypothetical protein R2864_02550 [Syntrophotaleaceae bacterium]